MDIAIAVVALILCAPVIGLLGVLIKLQDRGPIFYKRRVVGQNNYFDAYKLRTMRVDADQILQRDSVLRQEFEINFKLRDDPRVTRVGTFLRRTSLDELPQLWNVLKGEMSLIGPRMISPAELEKYGDARWIFHSFRPGITGYWQVHGTAGGYERRVAMDKFYAENWSWWLDLKILLQTPARMVRGTEVE